MLALKKNYSEVSWLCHLLYKRPHIAEAVEELRPEGVLNVRSYQKRTFSPASD